MTAASLPAVLNRAITEQKIDLTKVNLLLPTQSFGAVVGDYDKVTIEIVTIDPDPKAGDVYEISRGKKTLGKRPLMAIANALGISWDANGTTILESTSTKSRAKATGALRKPNGEILVISEEKTVDIEVLEDEIRLDALKGKREWNDSTRRMDYRPWTNPDEKELEIKKGLLSARKFKDEKAMTGAKERVIRAFLAIKNFYTAEELSVPLAFPRVTIDSSKLLADPLYRAEAIRNMTGSVASIFGPSASTTEPRNVTSPPAPMTIELSPEPETVEIDPFQLPEPSKFIADPTPVEQMRREIVKMSAEVSKDLKVRIDKWLETPEAQDEKALTSRIGWLKSQIGGGK